MPEFFAGWCTAWGNRGDLLLRLCLPTLRLALASAAWLRSCWGKQEDGTAKLDSKEKGLVNPSTTKQWGWSQRGVLGYLFSKASIPSVIRDPQSLLPSPRMPAVFLRFYCSQLCRMQSFVPLPINTSSHSIYCLVVFARTSGLRCEGLIRPYLPLSWSLRKGPLTEHGKSCRQSPDILQWLCWFPLSENIGSFHQGRLQDFAPSGTIVNRYFFFLNLLIWWILLTFNY